MPVEHRTSPSDGPRPLSIHVQRRMEHQATRDTSPERALRRELHRRGLRYRVDTSPLPGERSRADLVFRPSRVAVFVDGCFWHGCQQHGVMPKNNREWWAEKLATNRARDERVDALLRKAGWEPVRVWEHEDPVGAADRIEALITRRRAG